MHQPAGRVLCFGVLAIDQIVQVVEYPEQDGHTRILSNGEFIGGEAANTALNLCGLKVPVTLRGNTLGEDRQGTLFRELIQEFSVDSSGMDVQSGVRTATALILSDQQGARTICGFAPDLQSRSILESDLEGITLLSVDPFLGNHAVEAARLAQEMGIVVFSIEITGDHPLAPFCDVVVNSSGFIRRHEIGSHIDVAIELLKAGVKTVVITQGGEGCTAYLENGRTLIQPAYSVPVIDTTGAGDAFRSGLILGFLKGWTLTRGIQFASGCGALACRILGGNGRIQGEGEVLQLIGRP